MFKATLIENDRYYSLKSKQLLLSLFPLIPMSLLVSIYELPIWLTALIGGLYLLIIFGMFRNYKQIRTILDHKHIEMDAEEIRIRSKNGTQSEVIPLDDIDQLILKDSYAMPQESLKDIGQELIGRMKRNYLILQQREQHRTFNFDIDSHYMLAQLHKIIEDWEVRGYKIIRNHQT
ncbi:MAG: hypothetical protein AAF587_29390 [Bacteroidota bacterium]